MSQKSNLNYASSATTEPPRRPLDAVIVAVGLLVASGLGFRWLDGYLAGPGSRATLPPGILAHIPLMIGPWRGRDVPVDEEIRRVTDADDLVNRQYVHEGGFDEVSFYVAYGVRARDLVPHRPEVCYPGAGWTPQGADRVELELPDDVKLKCRVLRFGRGVFDLRTIVVVNYYIIDDEFWSDVSELRSRSAFGSRNVRYMAQCQVSCETNAMRDVAAATRIARSFAADSAQAVRAIFAAPPAARGTSTSASTDGTP